MVTVGLSGAGGAAPGHWFTFDAGGMRFMYRRDLIDMLRDHPVSLDELATLLGTPARDLEDDLQHLIKSLRNTSSQVVVTPARCRKCGFVFHKDKLRKPGKCPACRASWISAPRISVEEPR